MLNLQCVKTRIIKKGPSGKTHASLVKETQFVQENPGASKYEILLM